jgi:hypothetical protein
MNKNHPRSNLSIAKKLMNLRFDGSNNEPINALITLPAVLLCMIIVISFMTACGPEPTSTPTPTFTPTPPPTSTETPLPTETSTPTVTPEPTVAKVSARVCAVLEDGKAAGGAYIQISDANFKQVVPDDGTTGIQTSSSGCITVKLPPGLYHIRSQKVINPYEGLYISGGADVDFVLGESLEISIELFE